MDSECPYSVFIDKIGLSPLWERPWNRNLEVKGILRHVLMQPRKLSNQPKNHVCRLSITNKKTKSLKKINNTYNYTPCTSKHHNRRNISIEMLQYT